MAENQSVNSMEAALETGRAAAKSSRWSTGWGQQAAEGCVWVRMELPESRSATAASPALLMGANTGRRQYWWV